MLIYAFTEVYIAISKVKLELTLFNCTSDNTYMAHSSRQQIIWSGK
jgi:hypothetical protein